MSIVNVKKVEEEIIFGANTDGRSNIIFIATSKTLSQIKRCPHLLVGGLLLNQIYDVKGKNSESPGLVP